MFMSHYATEVCKCPEANLDERAVAEYLCPRVVWVVQDELVHHFADVHWFAHSAPPFLMRIALISEMR